LRIAFIYDYGLPNPWIERAMYTLIKKGYEVHYIGQYRGHTGIFNISKIVIHNIDRWDYKVNAKIQPYYYWVKRKVGKVLKNIRPDIIFAVNVYSGIIAHELGYPLILVDLEFNSFKRVFGLGTLKNYIKYRKMFMLIKDLEYETILAEKYPVIVVTKIGYIYYKYHLGSNKVTILKAYPLKSEGQKAKSLLPSPKDKVTFIFIGKEISDQINRTLDSTYKYVFNARIIKPTIDALYKVFKKERNMRLLVVGDSNLKSKDFIESIGYLKYHVDIYEYIAKSHFGLCTYQPSLVHLRGSINRVYMFTLLGLPVFLTSTYIDVVDDIRDHAIIIDSCNYEKDLYTKFLETIESFEYDEYIKIRERLRKYAMNNLVLEVQEHLLLGILSKA